MKTKKIAIIDTGCNYKFKSTKNKISGYSLCVNNQKIYKSSNYNDNIGHGTAVLCVLEKCIKNADITMIKFDERYCKKHGMDLWLCLALEYIQKNEKFDVINLSLGFSICRYQNRLQNLCNELMSSGTIIVAAYDNDGALSYPAVYNSVIGIDNSDFVYGNQYNYIDTTVNILMANKSWKLPSFCKNYKNTRGNSFLTPIISAKVYKMLTSGIKPQEIICALKKDSANVQFKNRYDYNTSIFSIKKAVVLPFNKEITAIARNEDILYFKVAGYYDYSISGKIGMDIGQQLNCNNNKQIKNILDLPWEEDFDTVILSHVNILSKLIHEDIKLSIIKKCLKYNKNLYMFDEDQYIGENNLTYWQEVFKKKNLWLKTPNKTINIHPEWGGKLYNISCPVICVAGTNSAQGKFTVQLGLRNNMKKLGINVCNFGTEPSSELLGFEGAYTIGYNARMIYQGWKNVLATNYALHEIEKFHPDIIITGLQSRTITPKIAAFKSYPIKQQEFLLGCAPDSYVFCVDPVDSLKYIKQSINYLESLFPSKVICICFNDVQNSVRFSRKIVIFLKNLMICKKYTYFLSSNSSIKRITKKCIRYYK